VRRNPNARFLRVALVLVSVLPAALPVRGQEAPVPDAAEPDRWPSPTGIGIYLGYPSWLGIQWLAPADGPLGFRLGLTGFPGAGALLSPGVEYRLNQEAGTYSKDGTYVCTNLLLGRSLRGPDHSFVGAEGDIGYRWCLSDRRGPRWIAGMEGGAHWNLHSRWPDHPSFRFYWMLAGN
jgi:hypothetical protein